MLDPTRAAGVTVAATTGAEEVVGATAAAGLGGSWTVLLGTLWVSRGVFVPLESLLAGGGNVIFSVVGPGTALVPLVVPAEDVAVPVETAVAPPAVPLVTGVVGDVPLVGGTVGFVTPPGVVVFATDVDGVLVVGAAVIAVVIGALVLVAATALFRSAGATTIDPAAVLGCTLELVGVCDDVTVDACGVVVTTGATTTGLGDAVKFSPGGGGVVFLPETSQTHTHMRMS